MKLKCVICMTAALMLVCAAASADYMQIAGEAAERGLPQAQEMMDYVRASGAAMDPLAEMRRLYIWDYYLNIEREKLGIRQNTYEMAYNQLNVDGELDYLSDEAYSCAMEANDILGELERDRSYLSRLSLEKRTDSIAENMANSLLAEEKETRGNPLIWTVILLLTALAVTAVMFMLSRTARRGLRSMTVRDLRRSLLKGRWPILAVGLGCAAIAALLTLPAKSSGFEPLPDSDGEYAMTVESLMEYCDALAVQSPSLEPRLRNIKRYQLSAAMGEILNNRAAKNVNEVLAYYRSRAEELRHESEAFNTAAWQNYHSALSGPKDKYSGQIDTYISQAVAAQFRTVDAEYCDNIAALMERKGEIDASAPARVEERISSAVGALRNLTVGEPQYGRTVKAVLAGFGLGLTAGILAAGLIEPIRLSLRRRRERRRMAAAAHGETVEQISERG